MVQACGHGRHGLTGQIPPFFFSQTVCKNVGVRGGKRGHYGAVEGGAHITSSARRRGVNGAGRVSRPGTHTRAPFADRTLLGGVGPQPQGCNLQVIQEGSRHHERVVGRSAAGGELFPSPRDDPDAATCWRGVCHYRQGIGTGD
jgi:hypothetical protein